MLLGYRFSRTLSIVHCQLSTGEELTVALNTTTGALQLLGSNPEWCRKYGEADVDRQYTESEIGGKYKDSAKNFFSSPAGFGYRSVTKVAALAEEG